MTDLVRKRGDTYADEFQLTSETTGALIDITGYTFLLTIDPEKSPVDDTNNLYQLTGSITVAATGLVEFAPSAVQTDLLGSYYFDAQLTSPAGRIRTFDSGKYKFVQDITK
jgi:hypothetical protein